MKERGKGRQRQSERLRMGDRTPFGSSQNQKSIWDPVQAGGHRATRSSQTVTWISTGQTAKVLSGLADPP